MNAEKRIILLGWEEFDDMTKLLIEKIKAKNVFFDGVYGVPRGGLTLAVILSHCFDIPLLMYSTDKSLVVDDIADEGITLSNVKHKIIATLFSTAWTKTVPDCYVKMKGDRSSWIVMPWEDVEVEKKLIAEEYYYVR